MIRRFKPKSVPQSNAPFSQVVVDDHYAYLAGLVAADFPAGRQSASVGVGAETHAVLTVVQDILAELGLDMTRIVRTDVHLANLDDFDAMDEAYRKFFDDDQFPARTTTESPRLYGGSRVEITCLARLLDEA